MSYKKLIREIRFKTPLPEPSKDNTLDRDNVEKILEDEKNHDVTQTMLGNNYRPDTRKMADKILQLVPQQKPTEKEIVEVFYKFIKRNSYLDASIGNIFPDIAKEILNLYKGDKDGR